MLHTSLSSMTLLSCLLVLLLCIVHTCALSRTYDRGPVSLSANAQLYWTLDNNTRRISLALIVNDTSVLSNSGSAWIALGVSEESSGSMLGSDIASAEFGSSMLNNCTLRDRHVPFAAYPLGRKTKNASSVYPFEDKCQTDGSWKLVSCAREVANGSATLELERGLDAHDDQDRPIRSGSQAMIYAYGGSDFKYHGKLRGSSRVVFFNDDGTYPGEEEFPLPKDITFTHTIQATNYSVPSANDTTYACTSNIVPMPKGGKRYLVAADPIIKSMSGNNKAHHLIVYGCKDTAYGRGFFKTGYCMGEGPVGNGGCTALLHGWAQGSGRFLLPEGVGLEIDETNNFLVMETHYDNSERDTNAIDVSGAKLYFSDSRPILAGLLTVGDTSLSRYGETVKNNYEYVSTCPSNCTSVWKEEINLFVSFLHMHTTGRKIYTNRFDKDGKFLETINSIEYWSNDHQYIREFKKPKKITPGDTLSTTCVFDTRKKPATKFGPETKDEMCMEFIFYYPLQKRFSSDGSMFDCSGLQLRGNSSATMCGSPTDERAFSFQANPSLNDTIDTPETFGNPPDTCASMLTQTSLPNTPNEQPNSTVGQSSNASRTGCFPSDSVLQTRSGKLRMSELNIGDEVLVNNATYSPVFMFTHRVPDIRFEFLQLRTTTRMITLTHTHYLHVGDAIVAARDVQVGHVLRMGDGEGEKVVQVRRVMRSGLYNPQTVHGDIVVDGIVASCYTQAVRWDAAHGMLAPVRAVRKAFGWRLTAFERDEYVAMRGFQKLRSLVLA